MKKGLTIFFILFLLVLGGFVYFKFFFVFGEGVKAGELNYMVRKGVIFKTYEGKLIQSGFRRSSGKMANTGGIQSYEFEFSVEDEEIANKLMMSSSKNMELRYKEYNGALPWRGFSKYIVYEIVAIDGDVNIDEVSKRDKIQTP